MVVQALMNKVEEKYDKTKHRIVYIYTTLGTGYEFILVYITGGPPLAVSAAKISLQQRVSKGEFMAVCILVYMYVCMDGCMYVCMYVCMHLFILYVYCTCAKYTCLFIEEFTCISFQEIPIHLMVKLLSPCPMLFQALMDKVEERI